MEYQANELNPAPVVLLIDSEEIEISFISLKIDGILQKKFNGLTGVYSLIKENPVSIIEIIWVLVRNKSRFSFSLEVFKNHCLTSKESLQDVAMKMKQCLDDSVNASMPLVKNPKRVKELNAINKATTQEGVCYGVYYDRIAKRYGYSLEQFYDLTLRNIHIFLNVIGDESYKELEIKASLAGRDLKPRMKMNDISPEEEAEQEKQALEALAELQKRYKEGQANGR